MSDHHDKSKRESTDFFGPLVCSFCGRDESQVDRMIAGPGIFICNECVELCADMLKSEAEIAKS